ncbi:MAG: amino acid ABC transporter substrate-binding protein [Burkholderiales bacterium]
MKKHWLSTAAFTLLSTAAISTAAFSQGTGTLGKIKETSTITVGNRDASVPFSYLDDKAQPVGFAMDLCARIVDAVKKNVGVPNLNVKYQVVTSANRIPLLQNGVIDIECGSTTNTEARQKQVEFAMSHFFTGTRFLVRKDSGIKTWDDLKGKRIVSTTGTTNVGVIREFIKERGLGTDVIFGRDHAESFLLVEQGRADAFGMDDILLYGLRANAAKPQDFEVIGDALLVEPYGIMVRRDDPAFKKIVDDTLIGMMKSGEFTTLYRKWFQSPIPPKNVNLNLPMSKELADHLKSPTDKPVR